MTMARRRAQEEPSPSTIALKQPDRSCPDLSRETLLGIADKRGLNGGDASTELNELSNPPIGRLGEAILWSISLAMLHFTFDVLTQNQYAVEISWSSITAKSLQAFVGKPEAKTIQPFAPDSANWLSSVILLLFYILHPHPTPSPFLPRLPQRYSYVLHQLMFFLGSVLTGCYLIHITNKYNYYAVLKQAPPLGCMWIWSVIELDLKWAVGSLICCGAFLRWGGYSYL